MGFLGVLGELYISVKRYMYCATLRYDTLCYAALCKCSVGG